MVYEVLRIAKEFMPKYIIWENVKGLTFKKHKPVLDDYIARLNDMGYTSTWQILNSKDYGVPQNRARVFVVSIRNDLDTNFIFPEKQELKLRLKDILEENVDDSYYLSDKMIKCFLSKKGSYDRKTEFLRTLNNQDIARTLTTSGGNRSSDAYIVDGLNTNLYLGTYQYAKSENFMKGKDRLNLGKDISDTIQTTQKEGVCFGDLEAQVNSEITISNINNLRIRRLTTLEAFRLMGFDDSDWEKASEVNSKTALYKQAGNSIVVNVIEAIFDNLLKDYQ